MHELLDRDNKYAKRTCGSLLKLIIKNNILRLMLLISLVVRYINLSLASFSSLSSFSLTNSSDYMTKIKTSLGTQRQFDDTFNVKRALHSPSKKYFKM